MTANVRKQRIVFLFLVIALLAVACSRPAAPEEDSASGSPAGEPAANGASGAPGEGWPREFVDARGQVITLPSAPKRIVALSLGLEEVAMALVGPERFAAVTESARSQFGNIAQQAAMVDAIVRNDLESLLALNPDIVFVDGFANPELIQQAESAGLTVIVTDLHMTVEEHLENIRFMARALGVEQRGEEIIAEVNRRLERLKDLVTVNLGDGPRPRVIQLTTGLFVPGAGATADDLIRLAGGINAAAEAGIWDWQQISLETVIDLAPEAIFYNPYDYEDEEFRRDVLENPAMQEVPAIRDGRLFVIPHRYTSTLSFWSLRGAEELARHLWSIEDAEFSDFDF